MAYNRVKKRWKIHNIAIHRTVIEYSPQNVPPVDFNFR